MLNNVYTSLYCCNTARNSARTASVSFSASTSPITPIVGIFTSFRLRMISSDARAEPVFINDMESTYKHLVERVRISQEEESIGKEQIQLIPENPNQTISFNVPDGPPPDDLVLEGPGTENMDVNEVRKALQFRWDVFEGFPEDFQEALKTNELDAVNKVLGDMEVSVAESIVQQLDMAGILSFAEGGIRDETPAGKAATAGSSGVTEVD